MKNHETIPGWCEDSGCPVHKSPKSPVKKIYRFGKFEDAEVAVFAGCRCAVCVNAASLLCGVPLGHEITYHTSYEAAAGRAKLIVAGEAVANRAFA